MRYLNEIEDVELMEAIKFYMLQLAVKLEKEETKDL